MKLHTEHEIIDYQQNQAVQLSLLFKKDKELFYQICDQLHFSVHVNKRESLDMVFASGKLASYFDIDTKDIYENGFSFIKPYLDETVLQKSLSLIKTFDALNDTHKICSYLQLAKIYGKWSFLMTQKIVLDDAHFFNINQILKDFGKPGKVAHDLLDEYILRKQGLKKILSLTNRERDVLRLLADGLSNKEISDQLFISNLTVQTHRKTIYQKLDAKSVSELTKYALAFDMI